ncbi:MAG TPA: DUF4837 family protein [Bacteroidaceae bacterium]|nr:DUF4837 family protein [Bacteroidaceae bacterium]
MKKINALILLIFCLIGLVSCSSGGGKKTIITPSSTGIPYEILVVADTDDFQSTAVESISKVLGSEIPGLPQSESAFKVSKTNSNKFYKTLRFCRNIVIINIDRIYTQPKIKYSRNVYSSPQVIMTIQAPDAESFSSYVAKNEEIIVDFFTKAEMNNEIDLLKTKHSHFVKEQMKRIFDCEIYVPMELIKHKIGDNFFWASTDKGERDMNFVAYSFPYTDVNTFTPDYFFNMRNSVMRANIPGPRDGQYMTTPRPYVTVVDSEVRGKYAQIARGLWEMENYDMGGPFVSISRVDEKNQRVIVVEAFVYAPGFEKRNLIRRMEAALYTLKLPDELDESKFKYDIEEVVISSKE